MDTCKSIATVFLFTLITFACGREKSNSFKGTIEAPELNGFYVGLEEIGVVLDPSQPERKWYHLGTLHLKGDSAFLKQSPVSIYKADTSFSASDGAFYYYNGTYEVNDSMLIFKLKMDHCDYCAREVRESKNGQYEEIEQLKELVAIIKPQGLLINDYLYRKRGNNYPRPIRTLTR